MTIALEIFKKPKPLVCIVGPTAIGKSTSAVQLASRLNGEIVSADSRQIYRRMDIGTAKVARKYREMVPHHLIDICDPDERYSIRTFIDNAELAITGIQSRGRLPIVVGGSGHYVTSLIQGMIPSPVRPNAELRAELAKLLQTTGIEALADRLLKLDAEGHSSIDLNNPRRIMRAIEVFVQTGSSIRDLETTKPVPWNALVIGLVTDSNILSRNIAERTRAMFQNGLLDEVRTLLAAGYGWQSAVGRSIGYSEALKYILGRSSLQEAIDLCMIATRQYARRQMTWFRNKQQSIQWLQADDNLDKTLGRIVNEFLCENSESEEVNAVH